MTINSIKNWAESEAASYDTEGVFYLGFIFDNRTGEVRERQFGDIDIAEDWLQGVRMGWYLAKDEWDSPDIDLALFTCKNGECQEIKIF